MNMKMRALAAAILILPAAACSGTGSGLTEPFGEHAAAVSADPQAAFLAGLRALCGQAFAGRLVSDDDADADMRAADMIMHVRDCDDDGVRIPFHVETAEGWDRSRTWIVRKSTEGLHLKHDHRHADGSEDAVSMYGGDTAGEGTQNRQEFHVDEESISLFRKEGLHASVSNIWAMDKDDSRFAYELRRTGENARFFRVEFDLTAPVTAPPAPWGAR